MHLNGSRMLTSVRFDEEFLLLWTGFHFKFFVLFLPDIGRQLIYGCSDNESEIDYGGMSV